jgi:hypothetical protein
MLVALSACRIGLQSFPLASAARDSHNDDSISKTQYRAPNLRHCSTTFMKWQPCVLQIDLERVLVVTQKDYDVQMIEKRLPF